MSRYGRTATHIRGRVYLERPRTKRERPRWRMEVINHRTGKVIADDNCTKFSGMTELASEATAMARGAWFWSYTKKAVR